MKSWKPLLSTLGSAFAGGAAAYASAHLAAGALPTTAQSVGSFCAGAALAGLIAVIHLYQPAPGQESK